MLILSIHASKHQIPPETAYSTRCEWKIDSYQECLEYNSCVSGDVFRRIFDVHKRPRPAFDEDVKYSWGSV